jgi:adenylosuccinate synthase
MKKKIDIVLGALFGDEGKGQTVHSLSTPGTLVVRFSGGHQVGHTVVTEDGKEHIFCQFGSGTFKGASTHISEYCTIYPTSMKREFDELRQKIDIKSVLQKYTVSPLTMITTPYDVLYNHIIHKGQTEKHGSVGVGFGTTIQRNEDHYTLYAADLLSPFIREEKLKQIKNYYYNKLKITNSVFNSLNNETFNQNIHSGILSAFESKIDELMDDFNKSIEWFIKNIIVYEPTFVINHPKHVVFEGSQGIQLDQKLGVFPHVTRSNTTALNAMEWMKNRLLTRKSTKYDEEVIGSVNIRVHYVTRAYMTRHGNGPFPNDTPHTNLIKDATLSNPPSFFQGEMKTAPMDFQLLKNSILYNQSIMQRYINFLDYNENLVVTCCDQIEKLDKEKFEDILPDTSFKYQRNWSK